MSRLTEIEVQIQHETGMAVLVKNADGRKAWLPLSQVEVRPCENGSGLNVIELPEWLAEEKELV
jgi:hypothetical protein